MPLSVAKISWCVIRKLLSLLMFVIHMSSSSSLTGGVLVLFVFGFH
jgi:hypothetical protein